MYMTKKDEDFYGGSYEPKDDDDELTPFQEDMMRVAILLILVIFILIMVKLIGSI